MSRSFIKKFEKAEDLSEMFQIVKEIVYEYTGEERAGLMLGLAEMGGGPGQFIGAFHPVGSNVIVLNKTPMKVVESAKPQLYKAYCFHLLLHEYLHSIGIFDEEITRTVTAVISERSFGKYHPVSLVAKDFNSIFPEIFYSSLFWRPNEGFNIEIVKDFDRRSVTYIG